MAIGLQTRQDKNNSPSDFGNHSTVGTTEFGERAKFFKWRRSFPTIRHTALHCTAAAPIVVAAYITGDLTLNLGKPLLGKKL